MSNFRSLFEFWHPWMTMKKNSYWKTEAIFVRAGPNLPRPLIFRSLWIFLLKVTFPKKIWFWSFPFGVCFGKASFEKSGKLKKLIWMILSWKVGVLAKSIRRARIWDQIFKEIRSFWDTTMAKMMDIALSKCFQCQNQSLWESLKTNFARYLNLISTIVTDISMFEVV